MARWDATLAEICQLQTRIMEHAPHRDIGLVGNPGASEQAIEAAEQRIGRSLPPSYREFLRRHDGWPRFFEGATLLGTANLGLRLYEDLARAAWDAAETPVPDLGPELMSARRSSRVLIPFAVDLQATTLFAFNPAITEGDEYEVIAWINELGVRRESFASFLELVLDLCSSELEAHTAQGSHVLNA